MSAHPSGPRPVTPGRAGAADLERPYRRLSPLTPLVRGFLFLVAVLASTWDDLLGGRAGPVAWGLVGLVLVGAGYGAASWLRTKYWIEADELRVDTGVVSRQSRRIRVDRLQGIDIVQPFVARLFGLAELRMDVAGGGAREGSLAFLPLEEARSLRAALLSRRDAARATGQADEPAGQPVGAAGAGARVVEEAVPRERVLARLDLAMLLVSLLLSVETVLFVLACLAVAVTVGVLGDLGTVGGVAGVLPVLAGFGLAQFRKLSAFYGFTVSAVSSTSGPALQVRRGLFSLSTQTIALARVQGVLVSEPLPWRRLGWARLDVAVAGYSSGQDETGGLSASTVMPVAPRALVLSLARTLLSGPDPDAVALTPPPERSRWVDPVARRFRAGGLGADLAVAREGLWTRRTHAVPHARVQSVQMQQGPWQRRLGLADLRVDSPPGPVRARLRHRDAGEVRALLDREHALAAEARHRVRAGE